MTADEAPRDDMARAAEAIADAHQECPPGYIGRHGMTEQGIDDEAMASLICYRIAYLDGDRDLTDQWLVIARARLYDAGHTAATAMAAIHLAWPTVCYQADRILGFWDGLTDDGGTS